MKSMKRLGLLAVAVALISIAGSGTASATVLCKNTTEPCTEPYGVGTEIKETLEGTLVLKGGIEVTCTESTISAKVTNAGGATATANTTAEALTYGSCTGPVTVLAKPVTEWHWIPGSRNFTLTTVGEKVSVRVEALGVECVYQAGTSTAPVDEGLFTGLPQPVVHKTERYDKLSGSIFCANQATMTATYKVTSPTPIYAAGS